MVYLFLAFDIYLGSTVLFENDSSRSIVRFLLIEYTISPRPPLLSPTNFRNSEQSTTRGNRPLLETIRSSSTILFPLHTDRGAFRLSGVRTLGERSGQRAALSPRDASPPFTELEKLIYLKRGGENRTNSIPRNCR